MAFTCVVHTRFTAEPGTLDGMEITEFLMAFGVVVAMVLVGLLATVPTALEFA